MDNFLDTQSISSDASDLSDFSASDLSDFSDDSVFQDSPGQFNQPDNLTGGGDDSEDIFGGGDDSYDSDDSYGSDDIEKLESLVGGYSIGGDTDDSDKDKYTRKFVLVSVDGKDIPLKDGGSYTIATHRRDKKTGEMRSVRSYPGAAARKAFSGLCKKDKELHKKGGRRVFEIRETTRGSNKKVKAYVGTREKLKKPKVIDRVRVDSKTGKKTKVKNYINWKHTVKVQKSKSGGMSYYYA